MQLFNLFTAVQTLHIDRGHDHLPIENVTRERTTEASSEMLPALDLLYLDCLPQGAFVEKLVAACQHSSRPVTAVKSYREFEERLRSYLREEDEDPVPAE